MFYGWVIVGVGIVATCLGFGTMMSLGVFMPAIAADMGWSRTAMLTLGLIVWAVVIPAALLVRAPPAQPAGGGGTAAGEFTLAEALRTPQFAAIALAHFACCAAHSGPIFHMVSYAISCGVPALTATTVFGAAGFGGLFGRIIGGPLSARAGVKSGLLTPPALPAAFIRLY